MKDWFFVKILQWVGQKMDGKKTYAGSAGKVLIGIGPLIAGIVGLLGIAFPDQGLPQMDIDKALGLIAGGFYAMSSGLQGAGVAHKMDKQAVQATVIANTATAQRYDIASDQANAVASQTVEIKKEVQANVTTGCPQGQADPNG